MSEYPVQREQVAGLQGSPARSMVLERVKRIRRRWWVLLAVVALAALRIAFWGRPGKTEFVLRPAEKSGEWLIERRASQETWRAFDDDGDGVMDRFETPAGAWVRPGLRTPPIRWLIICLDNAPFVRLEALWQRGHFREFHRPSATVSLFPSDSETAITSALHSAPVPGYEHQYFDRTANAMRGGVFVTLTGTNVHYIRRFDYVATGWQKAVHYALPARSYRADLGRLRARFLASNDPVYLAHVSGGDAVFHLLEREETDRLLIEFEAVVRDLYLTARGELGVILWSDHGNTLTVSRGVELADLLERRGWRLTTSLQGPRDAVVPAYGLVGFFVVYCQREAIPRLAQDLRALRGADLVIYRHPAGHAAVILDDSEDHHGRAVLRWSADGSRYRYEAEEGDPLELCPVFEQLGAEGKLDAQGWARDADLFTATARGRYPDAAARIRGWATNHVRNPSDLVVSLKLGYYQGKGIFQHLVTMRGTHGALDAPSTLGFAMATHLLPPTVRLADLIPEELLNSLVKRDQRQ